MPHIRVLATDMDGTFIPLGGDEENGRDLRSLTEFLAERQIQLVYVTGRHYELVLDAIRTDELPTPDWMICDVGTSIYHRTSDGEHQPLKAYAEHLSEIVSECSIRSLQEKLCEVAGLRLQAAEKQGRFKLSYDCDRDDLRASCDAILEIIRAQHLPYHTISSVDPFTDEGLIDLLPAAVTKAYALRWWTAHVGHASESVMFAGDSGNDLAALTEGYCSIVVANAAAELCNRVRDEHLRSGWRDRLFIANRVASSGVLDGVRHFVDGVDSDKD